MKNSIKKCFHISEFTFEFETLSKINIRKTYVTITKHSKQYLHSATV